MPNIPAPAVRLMLSQHGVVGRAQLKRFITEKAVDGLVRHGILTIVERGVYRSALAPLTPQGRAQARIIRARPDARLSGPFVLGLLDVDGFTPAAESLVLTAPGRRMRNVDFPHRPDPVPGRRTVEIAGMPCLHPVESLVDVAATPISDRALRVTVDVLRRRGTWSDARLAAELSARRRTDPGVVRLERLLGGTDADCDTEPERELGTIVRMIDPTAEPQVWVTPVRRVDWFLRAIRLGIEFHGRVDHEFDEGRRADADRDEELASVGVRIVPVYRRDLDDPASLRVWLTSVIRARQFELGRHAG